MEYNCKKCNKKYASYKSLWFHNFKYHKIEVNTEILLHHTKIPKNPIKHKCKNCNIIFSRKDSLTRHNKTNKCIKITLENNNKIEVLEKKMAEYKAETERLKSKKINPNKDIEEELKNIKNDSKKLNNQLINIIIDKNKTIEKLKETTNNIISDNESEQLIKEDICEIPTLTINNIIIISRIEDNYINATQLCQAGNKKFNDWLSLDSSKDLILALETKEGIPALDLVEINKGGKHNGSWIHPDLAIQIAQWISPIFALQVSHWMRTLFNKGKIEIDIKMMKDKDSELKIKTQKIKLLENICIKKQHRINYPEDNVIYMVTTEDNKNKRIYIIGKAKRLKSRLSSYNKTTEHEVIYYKGCNSEEEMNIIEMIVLMKLNIYKEKANRDRFILPIEKNISFFIDIIDDSINMFNKKSKELIV